MKLQIHRPSIERSATVKDFVTFTSLDIYLVDYQGNKIDIDLMFGDREGPMNLVNAIVAAINTREETGT